MHLTVVDRFNNGDIRNQSEAKSKKDHLQWLMVFGRLGISWAKTLKLAPRQREHKSPKDRPGRQLL